MNTGDIQSLINSISQTDSQWCAMTPRDYTMADYSHELIMEEIQEFENTLDQDHEVALMLASFGQSVTMAVTKIGYANPSTLFFYGFVNGNPATLIQHLSQLNFLLLAVQKEDPTKPPRRIGFISDAEESPSTHP